MSLVTDWVSLEADCGRVLTCRTFKRIVLGINICGSEGKDQDWADREVKKLRMPSDRLGQLHVGLQSYSALQSCFKLGEDGQAFMLSHQSVTDVVYPVKGTTEGKAALCS